MKRGHDARDCSDAPRIFPRHASYHLPRWFEDRIHVRMTDVTDISDINLITEVKKMIPGRYARPGAGVTYPTLLGNRPLPRSRSLAIVWDRARPKPFLEPTGATT